MCMDTNIYYKDRKIFMRIYQNPYHGYFSGGREELQLYWNFCIWKIEIVADYKLLTYYLLSSYVLLKLVIYISWLVLQIKAASKLKLEITGWDYGKVLKGDWLQWDMGLFSLFFVYSAAQNVNTRVELQGSSLRP